MVSTDPAHSLADSFDVPLGPDPVAVAPNLWGQEIDVLEELVGLLYISQYSDTQDYDLLIVDCAPTGETLRLLSFPEVAR